MIGNWFVPRERVRRTLMLATRLERRGDRWSARVAEYLRYRLARTWGVYVHRNATVGDIDFAHPTSVVIGAGVVVEDGVTLYQGVTLGADQIGGLYPLIRSGAILYGGSTVIGGVVVGRNAVIGAHSVVLDDVPDGATVAGAPARILHPRAS